MSLNKKILLYGIIYLIFLIGMIIFFQTMFDLQVIAENTLDVKAEYSLGKAFSIIENNLKNFGEYFLLFPIYPIIFCIELIFTSSAIAVSIENNGMMKTIILLMPHGIIEIPNFIVYTALSFIQFRDFLKRKQIGFKVYLENVRKYKIYYIGIIIAIIAAGLIEGLLTGRIYYKIYG